jgi:hypothetical protein
MSNYRRERTPIIWFCVRGAEQKWGRPGHATLAWLVSLGGPVGEGAGDGGGAAGDI